MMGEHLENQDETTDEKKSTISDVQNIVYDLNQAAQVIKEGGQGFKEVITSLIEYKKVEKITKSEVEKYKTIAKNIDFYRDQFSRIFDQREMGLQKCFDIIDKGMSENNLPLISLGLSKMSDIVTSSPFKNIKQLRLAIESGEKIVL
jgi:hypothetical protein